MDVAGASRRTDGGRGSVAENYFELSKQLEIMTAMFRELNIYYVDEIQPGQLMETGMDAMVESLDPYTVYYPESRVEDLRFMTTGEYGGIGASMQFINDRHLIVDVLPDFPAARAGLKIGDELLAIDGQPLKHGPGPRAGNAARRKRHHC